MYRAEVYCAFASALGKKEVLQFWVSCGEGFHEDEKAGIISFDIGDLLIKVSSDEESLFAEIQCRFLDPLDGLRAHKKIEECMKKYNLVEIDNKERNSDTV